MKERGKEDENSAGTGLIFKVTLISFVPRNQLLLHNITNQW